MGQKTFTQFRVDNIVTTLPTTLEYGKEVYYKDASGNLTLWVGHEDGTAWPAVGYKEMRFYYTQVGTSAPTATKIYDQIGVTISSSRLDAGVYEFPISAIPTFGAFQNLGTVEAIVPLSRYDNPNLGVNFNAYNITNVSDNNLIISQIQFDSFTLPADSDNASQKIHITIRIYP
jgi:hypothetical protein